MVSVDIEKMNVSEIISIFDKQYRVINYIDEGIEQYFIDEIQLSDEVLTKLVNIVIGEFNNILSYIVIPITKVYQRQYVITEERYLEDIMIKLKYLYQGWILKFDELRSEYYDDFDSYMIKRMTNMIKTLTTEYKIVKHTLKLYNKPNNRVVRTFETTNELFDFLNTVIDHKY